MDIGIYRSCTPGYAIKKITSVIIAFRDSITQELRQAHVKIPARVFLYHRTPDVRIQFFFWQMKLLIKPQLTLIDLV